VNAPSGVAAIVFDFDGVIADTELAHFSAFRDVFATRGWILEQREYLECYLGCDDHDLVAGYAAAHALDLDGSARDALVAEKTRAFEPHLSSAGVLFPDAAACIDALAARMPLAIASGSTCREIEIVLRAAGLLSCFRAIVGADAPIARKPSPAPYLAAAAQLGVDPRLCVAVEDSPPGLASARAAGMRTIAVTTTLPASRLGGADRVIARLADLTPALVAALGPAACV
jgi:beta-phosphoglucomutase